MKRAWEAISYLLVFILVFFSLFPLFWILSTSIKPATEIFMIPPKWLPSRATLDNYRRVLFGSSMPKYFVNSLVAGLITTAASLLLGCSAGYGLARYRFRGRLETSLFILISQMFPVTVLIVPIYIFMSKLRLIDTIIGLSVAHLTFTMPLVTWMSRGYFMNIPQELEEAAQIDGCSYVQALILVVLPICAPGLAATAVYAFLMSWNEYVLASVLTISDASRTLPIGLTEFAVMFRVDWGSTMAAATLISLPVVTFFLILQRYFIQGLAQGAVKG